MSHNLKDIQDLDKKYNLLKEKVYKEKKEPSILFNEENYTELDWLEVRLAKESTKVNPEGLKIRQKIIDRLKNDTP